MGWKNIIVASSNLLRLRENLAGSHHDYLPFLILSAPRSGSTWLQSLLSSHPAIVCHQELLHRRRIELPLDQKSFGGIFKWTAKGELLFRNFFPATFVKCFVYGGYQENTRAVGVKILYEHLEGSRTARHFLSSLLATPRLKLIHLVRRNGLRAYLSHVLALKTKEWRLVSHTEQPSLNIGATLSYLQRRERLQAQLLQAFAQVPCHTLFYEDLIAQTEAELSGLMRFLQVPERSLYSPLVRQERRPLADSIANFREVEKALRGTHWENYLKDSITAKTLSEG